GGARTRGRRSFGCFATQRCAMVPATSMDAPSFRIAREEDAPQVAAAERTVASVPGRLASRPDEIHDEVLRKTIRDLADGVRGTFLVAEQAGALVGHAFLESLLLAVTSHVVRLTIVVH